MPGIIGIIAKTPASDFAASLRTMVCAMMREDFYTSTEIVDRESGFYLASIAIKDSFADCLPHAQGREDLALLLSGECYSTGNSADASPGRITAEHLLRLYEEGRDSFFGGVNGWLSGVLLDRNNRKVILFNDRYGMQRVYYHERKDAFYFASEAKALLKLLPGTRSLSRQGAGEYLAFDCVLNNRTLFENIHLLPGAAKWTFQNGTVTKEVYFRPEDWESQSPLDSRQAIQELSGAFSRIAPRYTQGPKVCMALTGGMDTRMILSSLHPEAQSLPCFTFGGMYRDSLDVSLSRRVTRACGQPHQVVRLGREFLSDYMRHLREGIYVSDGLANATTVDELYLNRLVRGIAGIKLTGKFGSQVMRGLAGLRHRLPDGNLVHPDFVREVSKALDTFTSLRRRNSLSFFLFSEIPWYWSGFTSLELSQLAVRSPYLDNDFVKLLYRVRGGLLDGDFQWNHIGRSDPKLVKIPTNSGYGDPSKPIRSRLIKTAYRAVETMDKIYTWDRVPHGLTHWVARADRVLAPLHAVNLFRGYGYFRHYRVWFRDELAPHVQEVLLDTKTLQRPYWNGRFLEKIVRDHMDGRGNYFLEIRKALSLEMIHRTLVEEM